MNLIKFEPKTISDAQWKIVNEYRAVDHSKVYPILDNMMKNIESLLPGNFKGVVTKEDNISPYLADSASYYEKIIIKMEADKHEQKLELLYPKMMQGNYFRMNGSMYVPILFLERSPIDVLKDEKKGNKIFINLLPTFNLTFNFQKNEVLFRKKSVELNTFMKALFDEEYFQSLVDDELIEDCILDDDERAAHVYKMMGFHETEFFSSNDLKLDDFFDEYILLDYFRGMFKDYFDVDNIKDIVKLVIKYHVEDIDINMSDIKNRRIVMNEYLINPIYEMYLRLLYGAIDKNEKQAFLPTMNSRVLITSGFRGLMHAGQYFNISLPYTSPAINKVSQDIYIINDGRIPKSWTANHPSGFGKLCPISVSAQKMGSNLVFTNDTRINYYGRIEE
jgi:hypothetical protein